MPSPEASINRKTFFLFNTYSLSNSYTRKAYYYYLQVRVNTPRGVCVSSELSVSVWGGTVWGAPWGSLAGGLGWVEGCRPQGSQQGSGEDRITPQPTCTLGERDASRWWRVLRGRSDYLGLSGDGEGPLMSEWQEETSRAKDQGECPSRENMERGDAKMGELAVLDY